MNNLPEVYCVYDRNTREVLDLSHFDELSLDSLAAFLKGGRSCLRFACHDLVAYGAFFAGRKYRVAGEKYNLRLVAA